jgi:hypothetical protein
VLGFSGNRPMHRAVLLLCESCIAIDLRWIVSEVLGSFRPRWSRKMKAQAFVALKFVWQAGRQATFRSGLDRFGLKNLDDWDKMV